MKIAVSATGPSLDAEVDPRFGRCQYFIIADPDTMEFEAVENPNLMAAGGAGISTAQMIANMEVQVVLTGNCGPNAYQTLSEAGVQVITGASGRVEEAIECYKAGMVQNSIEDYTVAGTQPSSQPGVGPRFSMGRGMGIGRGMGRGRGRGMGHGMTMPQAGPITQAQSSEQQIEMLKGQTEMLRQQLDAIQRRIAELGEKGG